MAAPVMFAFAPLPLHRQVFRELLASPFHTPDLDLSSMLWARTLSHPSPGIL